MEDLSREWSNLHYGKIWLYMKIDWKPERMKVWGDTWEKILVTKVKRVGGLD